MNKAIFAICFLLLPPTLRAQQLETGSNPPQSEPRAAPQADPQPTPQISNGPQDNSPASIQPGHPLDPADVDILTGKRDREMEAERQAAVSSMAGAYAGYGMYGGSYGMNGRWEAGWGMPLLPLARISSPFFFSRYWPMGFGHGAFRGRR